MELPPIITPASGVFARRVGDEMVILDSRSEMYLELSQTAASMWEIAIVCRDRAEALQQLGEQWADAPREVLAADFDRFIDDVVARGLAKTD